jgi:hypothetical protein
LLPEAEFRALAREVRETDETVRAEWG